MGRRAGATGGTCCFGWEPRRQVQWVAVAVSHSLSLSLNPVIETSQPYVCARLSHSHSRMYVCSNVLCADDPVGHHLLPCSRSATGSVRTKAWRLHNTTHALLGAVSLASRRPPAVQVPLPQDPARIGRLRRPWLTCTDTPPDSRVGSWHLCCRYE
jgi:hypothetical protein